MRVVLAADHRGFKLKEALKTYLLSAGHDVEDAGAHTLDPEDDFPDFAYPAAQMVAAAAGSKGIFLCGSGMGMDIVANKIKGIRATVGYSKASTMHAAERDGVNVITIAADVLSEDEAREIVDAFLMTPMTRDEKYLRRVQKIATIEDRHFR